jgi:hypothetical protein
VDRLAAPADETPARFQASLVADLPEPARRYLTRSIAVGTPRREVLLLDWR